MSTIENDFEKFFTSLKNQQFSNSQILEICKPLRNYYRLQKLKILSIIFLNLFALYVLVMWCDTINWILSALGRIILIQLLPYWNWTDLYKSKCLIDKPVNNDNNIRVTTNQKLQRYETEKENCLLCDTIDYIPSISNTTFTFLEATYLERSYPVIITDSHEAMSPTDIYQLMFNKSLDFLKSSPCDVSTNLMMNKFFDVEIALRKAWNFHYSIDKWFLQLRNCQFKAVKSSRTFIKKPYYYPVHLEPYYSSWLIMSHNYDHKYQQELFLQGLIIVQQLWGSLELSLNAKQPCSKCPVINILLKEGEGLVFSTDLWLFNYNFVSNDQSESITTIMEIDWNI